MELKLTERIQKPRRSIKRTRAPILLNHVLTRNFPKRLLDVKILPHLGVKWSDTPERVPLGTWHWAKRAMGGWRFFVWQQLLHPWESATLRSSDKCRRCLSFLLLSWRWLGDSHAIAQCLNKRVYLIQLSPQGCAKWALVLCDRDNERAERGRKKRRRRRGVVSGGMWGGGLKRETWAHSDVHTSFFLYSPRGFNVSVMTWLI